MRTHAASVLSAPASLLLVLFRGVGITIRNALTERFLGIDWTGLGVGEPPCASPVSVAIERWGKIKGRYRRDHGSR